MAFNIERALAIVLAVAGQIKPNKKDSVTADTRFQKDLRMDGVERRQFYIPTRNAMRADGYTVKTITANNMGKWAGKPVDTLGQFAAAIFADRTPYNDGQS